MQKGSPPVKVTLKIAADQVLPAVSLRNDNPKRAPRRVGLPSKKYPQRTINHRCCIPGTRTGSCSRAQPATSNSVPRIPQPTLQPRWLTICAELMGAFFFKRSLYWFTSFGGVVAVTRKAHLLPEQSSCGKARTIGRFDEVTAAPAPERELLGRIPAP